METQFKGVSTPVYTPPKYQKYLDSGHYAATGLDALQGQLANYNKTDEELRAQAQASYQPTYDAESLALQQKLQTLIQGYQNQLSGMEGGYKKQLDQTAATYARNLSDMLNGLTKRGMGRSSLVGTGSVAIANAEQAAQQGILDEWQTQQNNVANSIALAHQQSADSQALLDSSYAQQLENRINELRTSNQTASTQLQLQIAQMQYQGYLDWLKKKKKSGSSSKSTGSSGSSGSSGTSSTGGGSDSLINQISGGGSSGGGGGGGIGSGVSYTPN